MDGTSSGIPIENRGVRRGVSAVSGNPPEQRTCVCHNVHTYARTHVGQACLLHSLASHKYFFHVVIERARGKGEGEGKMRLASAVQLLLFMHTLKKNCCYLCTPYGHAFLLEALDVIVTDVIVTEVRVPKFLY